MTLLDTNKLTDWLKTQPPDQEYVWSDPVFCLMGRYLADNESRWGEVQYSDMPHYEEIAQQKPWTFGAALERAEALKALPSPDTREMLQIAAPVTVDVREPVTVDAG